MARPSFEVADVLNIGFDQYRRTHLLPVHIVKTAEAIMRCRTSVLGGNKYVCTSCGFERISYNSCRNRHCPKCQFSKREQWILDRKHDLLPVKYFHTVFTIPHELNPVAKQYPKIVYNILFEAAWYSVSTISQDPKWLGSQTGMVSLLHTWGQNLSLHPHLHCIIPNGGYNKDLHRWKFPRYSKFLFPVKVLSAVYKKKFLELLNQQNINLKLVWKDFDILLHDLEYKSFNVFAKPPFQSPDQVIEYIGRYSHRVAITNSRIKSIKDGSVLFEYRDYRDETQKLMNLNYEDFIQRFLQHVLPKGLAKIRHYGILSNRAKKENIPLILLYFERRQAAKIKFDPVQYFKVSFGIDLVCCPNCDIKTPLTLIMALNPINILPP
jgi:hypothetical protein